MKAGRKIRYSMAFLGLIILMAVLLAWNICAGSVNISVKEVTEVLFGEKTAQTASRIVWEIRLPRALAAAILGGALALAGYLLQTFFHNPIAGPFVLGISSGAKLVVALVMVFCLGHAFTVSSVTLILAAFIGACLSMGFVLCYGIEILILGAYAICWQQIIKKVDISVAYSNRASAIFWSTLWAAVVFHEHISVQNIIGIIVIFAGIWMVNRDA